MNNRKLAENIYDLIKVCSLSRKQSDEWEKLSREHGKEASQEIGKFIRNKNIEWNTNQILIGNKIIITISNR